MGPFTRLESLVLVHPALTKLSLGIPMNLVKIPYVLEIMALRACVTCPCGAGSEDVPPQSSTDRPAAVAVDQQ